MMQFEEAQLAEGRTSSRSQIVGCSNSIRTAMGGRGELGPAANDQSWPVCRTGCLGQKRGRRG